jgi:hypothetical protein
MGADSKKGGSSDVRDTRWLATAGRGRCRLLLSRVVAAMYRNPWNGLRYSSPVQIQKRAAATMAPKMWHTFFRSNRVIKVFSMKGYLANVLYVTEGSTWHFLFAFRWSFVEENFPWPGKRFTQWERSGKQRMDQDGFLYEQNWTVLYSSTYKRIISTCMHMDSYAHAYIVVSVEIYTTKQRRSWYICGHRPNNGEPLNGGTDPWTD